MNTADICLAWQLMEAVDNLLDQWLQLCIFSVILSMVAYLMSLSEPQALIIYTTILILSINEVPLEQNQ